MTSVDLQVPPSATEGIVTIGNFDGVHRGHQAMLGMVTDVANRQSRKAVVVTFEPHPVNVLKPEVCLPRLTTTESRGRLLKRYGADEVVVLPVSRALLDMSPEQFFSDIVLQQLSAVGLVEGPDFHFGKDRAGDTELLRSLCDAAGLTLTVIPAVCDSSKMISSTEIRRLLNEGCVSAANQQLGHFYALGGVVARGAGRGRTLGFPTANLGNVEVLIPADGVYVGSATIDGKRYPAAISIGPNPTFGDQARKVECHFVDFNGELYDEILAVELFERIRGLETFSSSDALIHQIHADVATCVEVFHACVES